MLEEQQVGRTRRIQNPLRPVTVATHDARMTSRQRRQRQLAPIRTGLYVRAANGRQLRDRSVQRLVAKVRAAMPWLTPADVPTARAWCELEVIARLVFAEMRTNGFTTGQGEPRRLLAEYRQLRTAQLAYARELGMTPNARASLRLNRQDPALTLQAYIRDHDNRSR
jgi:Phage terminase, small subunit